MGIGAALVVALIAGFCAGFFVCALMNIEED